MELIISILNKHQSNLNQIRNKFYLESFNMITQLEEYKALNLDIHKILLIIMNWKMIKHIWQNFPIKDNF